MEEKVLGKSLHLLRKNPVLYIPDLVMMIITAVLVLTLIKFIGAAAILNALQNPQTFTVDLLKTYVTNNLAQIIIGGIILFIISFILGVSMTLLKYSMIKEIISGKKASLRNAWREENKLFWSVVLLRIIVWIAVIIGLLAIVLLLVAIYLILNAFNHNIAVLLTTIGGIAILVLYLIFISLCLLFRYPYMFTKSDRNAFRVLKESIYFFKRHKIFTLVTWLIIVVISIIVGIGIIIINSILNTALTLISIALLTTVLSIVWYILSSLIRLSIDLWMYMYVFLKYTQKVKP